MTDDLKPHQRLVEQTWLEALERQLMNDELGEIMILTQQALRRAKHVRRIGSDFDRLPPPKPHPISPAKAKKAAHRAKVKAARKQNRGKR